MGLAGKPRVDRTGLRNGRLVLLSYLEGSRWQCVCDCGGTATVHISNLPRTHSCGCLNSEMVAARNETHGRSSAIEYAVWKGMIRRCTDPESAGFERYGGRGISVCDRWAGSIDAFISDMGPRPSNKHSIDRIDNDGNYEPGNCRWATAQEQSRNKARNRYVTVNGEKMTVTDAAAMLGACRETISCRLDRGWSEHDALHRPPANTNTHIKRVAKMRANETKENRR